MESILDKVGCYVPFVVISGADARPGLKASAILRRFTKDDSLVDASMRAVNWTFTYHGAPSGTILADEIIRDLSPHTGSELCTAVETAYSLAYLYQALGDNYYADRAELAIFNALPVMLTADTWAHQYMDQVNQPWATPNSDGIFTTSNSGVATSYGLEPEYPCCTVNFPQGYPKFLTHSWAKTSSSSSSGLVHMLLSPSTVTTTISGHTVTVKCDTDYPFSNALTYTVDSPVPFDLHLRIPSWSASNTSLIVNGVRQAVYSSSSKGNTRAVPLPPGHSTVVLILDLSPRAETRKHTGRISVYVGNLLYALDVGLAATSTPPHAYTDPHGAGMTDIPFPQVRDYYLDHARPWNAGIDPTTLIYRGLGATRGATLDTGVFDYARTPTSVEVRGCLVEWGLYLGKTPQDGPEGRGCLEGTVQGFRMIPFGAAKLHMAEVPVVDLKGVNGGDVGVVVNVEMDGMGEMSVGTDGGMGASVSGLGMPMQSVIMA